MTVDERKLLEEYVTGGKLMQLSTVCEDNSPRLCSVWYVPSFEPDRLHFLSRTDREHSQNIRRNRLVAGAIVDIPLVGLGQAARGVSFTGTATELPGTGVDDAIRAFVSRWPNAADALDAMPGSPSRLYEISVSEWVLFDEQNFRESPRRVTSGQ